MKMERRKSFRNLTRDQILQEIVRVPEVERSRPMPLTLEDLDNTGKYYLCSLCGFDNFNISVYNSITVNGKEWDTLIRCLRCPWRGRRSQLLKV